MELDFYLFAPFAIISACVFVYLQATTDPTNGTPLLTNQSKYAFATVTSPAFCMGAIALGHTLRKYNGDNYSYLCIVTSDVNEKWRRILSQWWRVVEQPEPRPHLWYRRSWIKLKLWTFTEYEKIIYLDTDTLTFSRMDELFDKPELSCVPDLNPAQICNTGVLVLKPNMSTYHDMIKKSKYERMNHPPGDQGFINAYFGKFNPIEAKYNLPRIADTGFGKAYKDGIMKVAHFVCKKPWKCGRAKMNECGCGYPEFNRIWYETFDEACKDHECWENWDE